MGKARKRARAIVLESMEKDLAHLEDRAPRTWWNLCGAGHAKPTAEIVDTIYGPMKETELHRRILTDSDAQLGLVHQEQVQRRRAVIEAYRAGEKLSA